MDLNGGQLTAHRLIIGARGGFQPERPLLLAVRNGICWSWREGTNAPHCFLKAVGWLTGKRQIETFSVLQQLLLTNINLTCGEVILRRIKLVGGPSDGRVLAGEFGEELRMVRTQDGYAQWTQPRAPLILNEVYKRSLRSHGKFVWQP